MDGEINMYMIYNKAKKIFEACMNELYMNSEPPISWDEIKEKYCGIERSEFYMKHHISEKLYEKITDKYKKQLTLFYRRQLSWYLLDYAPTFK
jgi:hypothetical protein